MNRLIVTIFGLIALNATAFADLPETLGLPRYQEKPSVRFDGHSFKVSPMPLVPYRRISLDELTEPRGLVGPPSLTAEKFESLKNEGVSEIYATALHLYSYHNFQDAHKLIVLTVEKAPKSATFWYWKAVIELQLGDEASARKSARKGAAIEVLIPEERQIAATSLERVQGPSRKFLRTAGEDLTLESARTLMK
jgi:hypothetical protein